MSADKISEAGQRSAPLQFLNDESRVVCMRLTCAAAWADRVGRDQGAAKCARLWVCADTMVTFGESGCAVVVFVLAGCDVGGLWSAEPCFDIRRRAG